MSMTQLLDPETGELFETELDFETAQSLIVKPLKSSKPSADDSKQNKDFIMVYRKYIAVLADLAVEDPQALRVLLFIMKFMDTKNALIVSMQTIADYIKLSRQTVSKKIKYLKDKGWICVGSLGRINFYIVNPDISWTAYAKQKSACKFEANVILSHEDYWAAVPKNLQTVKVFGKEMLKLTSIDLGTEEEVLNSVKGSDR